MKRRRTQPPHVDLEQPSEPSRVHLPAWVPPIPARLAERTRMVNVASRAPQDQSPEQFVLYWMHHALRVEDNPALELAVMLASRLSRPLLVYLGLSERYRFASDRHHTFILQGFQDVHAQLSTLGIPVVLHVERYGHRGPHLRTLVSRSCCTVTEEMPVAPTRGWLERLSSTTRVPILAVDCSCVVPLRLMGRAYARAFEFRSETQELRATRLQHPWPTLIWNGETEVPASLPFEPIDQPREINLAELVGQCDVDHLVAPVPHTPGGTTAGVARWADFCDNGLAAYADDRNDPLAVRGSRMSAYLHYGMVSPFRLTREAAERSGPGPEKFLDEMLVWRELSWSFCFHRPDHGLMSALPAWAIRTLVDHETDERPALLDWERLARGETGDSLWDAAQKSLLVHGELHNNVRMTWGKALLNWTQTPGHALDLLIDLNHRYALDGRDPSSYGGLLWCLGLFDRPITPAHPIFGTVRTRPTRDHTRRLDVARYHAHATRPLLDPLPKVAVIGAGLAGVTCARTLADHGIHVELFEKSFTLGGRMATRRAESGLEFDHGAQYFTARSELFRRYVSAWRERGLIAPWTEPVVELADNTPQPLFDQPERFVAQPEMPALAEHLARQLTVHRGVRVKVLTQDGRKWMLDISRADQITASSSSRKLTYHPAEPAGPFDVVIVALPAPQAAELLQGHEFAERCAAITMTPCHAAIVAFAEPTGLPFGGAFVSGSPIRWAARNSGKPGRSATPETWVLHATAEWSQANLDLPLIEVAALLPAAFSARLGRPLPPVTARLAHRWMYATAPKPKSEQSLFDANSGLAVAGDWLAGNRVEGAFLSGAATAGAVLRHALQAPETRS